MTDPTPGALGRYEIQGILGKGAMGVVYKARDPLIGRVLAIKTFRIAYLGDDHDMREFRARFLREAQSAGILNHPNIVTIHDVVEESEEGITFIAMEYVEGTNLKEVLRRGEPLDLGRVTHIVSEVGDALDYAHQKGVIHRDIKPANILLTKEGQVKLTDFGIARLEASDLTQDGQLLGTPNYMAPERILGRDVDRRTDVFSLGVVLYEMLTRQKPFQGDNLTMVTHRIVYEPFTPPLHHELDLPRDVVHVLEKAMAKEPSDRFATAGEMAAELQLATSFARESGHVYVSDTPTPEETDEEAATQDVSDHAARAAAADEELSDVEDFLSGEPADGWAENPAGGEAGLDETVAAGTIASPRSEDESSAPSASAPSPVPATEGAHGTRAVPRKGMGRFSWPPRGLPSSERLTPKVVLTGLGVGLLLLFAVIAVVFWPEGPPEDQAELAARELPKIEAAAATGHLRQARAALDQGELGRADRYIREGLLAAPDDPELQALRREVGDALTEAQLSAEREAQVASWMESARTALEDGNLDEAGGKLEQVALLAPEDDEARELERRLEEARAAAERARRARESRRAAAAEAEAAPEESPDFEEEPAEPEPSHLDLSIVFLTEISEGTLTIYAGDQQVVRDSFDFRKRTGIFRVEESAGRINVEPPLRLPRGETTFRVYVTRRGQSPLVETFRETFRGGTRPTLRIVVRKEGGMTVTVE